MQQRPGERRAVLFLRSRRVPRGGLCPWRRCGLRGWSPSQRGRCHGDQAVELSRFVLPVISKAQQFQMSGTGRKSLPLTRFLNYAASTLFGGLDDAAHTDLGSACNFPRRRDLGFGRGHARADAGEGAGCVVGPSLSMDRLLCRRRRRDAVGRDEMVKSLQNDPASRPIGAGYTAPSAARRRIQLSDATLVGCVEADVSKVEVNHAAIADPDPPIR